MKPTLLKVGLGEHDKRSSWPPRRDIGVEAFFTYPGYNPRGVDGDLVLIKLSQEVDLATFTPACLASRSHGDFSRQMALVYGWGVEKERGHPSGVLKEVGVRVVDQQTCREAMYMYMFHITDKMLCAGGVEGEDSCQGDSGGPLTYKVGDQHILIGEVSFGAGCGRRGTYGVYGRISFFREFIEKKMEKPKFCKGLDSASA